MGVQVTHLPMLGFLNFLFLFPCLCLHLCLCLYLTCRLTLAVARASHIHCDSESCFCVCAEHAFESWLLSHMRAGALAYHQMAHSPANNLPGFIAALLLASFASVVSAVQPSQRQRDSARSPSKAISHLKG